MGGKRMFRLAGFRNILGAAALIVGGLVLPHTASAATVSFDLLTSIGPGPYTIDGVSVDNLNGQLTVAFEEPALGSLTVVHTGETDFGTAVTGVSDTTIYAQVSGNIGPATHLKLITSAGSVADSLSLPIPAALPLFLTGTIMLYGVARGRKAKRKTTQVA